jgi:Tfp pilus assembly protein PilN
MIQFNLLPDIKIQYLKARRQKHLVMLGSTVVIIFSVAFLVIMISVVFGLQKKNIADLSRDIKDKSGQLQSTPNLNKMLTVQNQLTSLPTLHGSKPVASRLYGFLQQVVPTAASVSRVNIDYQKNTITITGAADSLATVNSFTDAMKLAKYATKDNPKSTKAAFSAVTLTTFSRDDKAASYTIDAQFDPALFSEENDVTLTVPNVTTRSNGGGSPALFQDTGTGAKQ